LSITYIAIFLIKVVIAEKKIGNSFSSESATQIRPLTFIEEANCQSFNDIKVDSNSADYVRNERYVFNIRGKKVFEYTDSLIDEIRTLKV